MIKNLTIGEALKDLKRQFVEDVRGVLKYHDILGLDGYPQSASIDAFLARDTLRNDEILPQIVVPPAELEKESEPFLENDFDKDSSISTLIEISQDVSSCRACGLVENRLFPVPGKNETGNIRLMIIGDWCIGQNGGAAGAEPILGVEEDLMVSRMLQAITLSKDSVFITNIIKCAIPESCQPKAEHVRVCLSFLNRQIMAIRPEVIITMGSIPARTLLSSSLSLSKLRGRFHDFKAGDGKIVPLLASYHPRFLLQNPEMKKAAWIDLQSLARHMALG